MNKEELMELEALRDAAKAESANDKAEFAIFTDRIKYVNALQKAAPELFASVNELLQRGDK